MKSTALTLASSPDVQPAAFAAFIGVDWSDKKQVYTLRQTAQPGTLQRGSFTMAQASDWVAGLRQRFAPRRVAVAIEAGRSPLICLLMEHADFIELYAIPTNAAASYRKSFVPSGAKADGPDADFLEDMLYCHQERWRPWRADEPDTRLLAGLCEARRHAVDERTRLTNQLTAKLKLSNPVVLELCEHLASPLALELLGRWPTLEKLQAAKPATVRSFFHKHHVRRPAYVQERLDLIGAAKPVCSDAALLLPAQLEIARLCRALGALLPAIADYDQRIAALFNAHADAFIYQSLPGAGPALEPRLLCAFGTQRERWPTAQSMQNFSGLSPVRKASGNSSQIHKRWHCPKYLRQSFHEYAQSSIKFCQWARELYERLRAKGKKHHTAIRTLAWRWLRILWRLWKDRVAYDEAHFTKAQAQHALKAHPAHPSPAATPL
jgi:transposase